ncbi:hypothetical protein BDP27DRAFT_1357732 [Rhodocollybia butyracea]|uniref:Uncharacterized protein n=1 Tax=Rhodocollybia butyracea TaxID=206335 RepID=A0A9P5UF72_9AGAR|nr:hypothetical protein BDP27DRAFT_1357732 [Rhodocollybia butyracea]
MSSEPPVILITGCSTGFGRSLAENSLARGLRVIATARRLSAIEDLRDKGAQVFTLNVDDTPQELKSFAEKAIGAFGQIDMLVNNAGWLLGGAIEEITPEEVKAQFDTNFFGVINVTNAFLPHFRSRKTGTIVNISSDASYLVLSGAAIYIASKAALDCITEIWAVELAPFNIRATSVNLGAFRTAVASSNTKPSTNTIDGYDIAHGWHKLFQERSGKELGNTDKGAAKLLDLVMMKTDKALPARFALGEDAVSLIKKCLNRRLAELEEWESFGMGTNVDGLKFEETEWCAFMSGVFHPLRIFAAIPLAFEYWNCDRLMEDILNVRQQGLRGWWLTQSPVILITGCSTGLGRCLAQNSLARGLHVIATARRSSAIEDLRDKGAQIFALDVTDTPQELNSFAEKAIGAFGQFDILVNNAGWILVGAIEENTPEQVKSQFDTNLFSVINITNAFLPHFRSRKTGTLVNISSAGSYVAVSGIGIYCTSKAAVECLTETWAHELAAFNIRAMSVTLGNFRTSIALPSSHKLPTKSIDGYDLAHQFDKMYHESSGKELGDPEKAAKKLLDVVMLKTDRPLPVRFTLGDDSVGLVRRSLKQRLAELDEWESFGTKLV